MITASKIGKNVNMISFFSVALMVLASPGAGFVAESRSPDAAVLRDGPRAVDKEPNNWYNNASDISLNDSVNGSLLIYPDDGDIRDYYKLDVLLPFGKVLCATLYMIDYDYSIPWKYHYKLRIYSDVENTTSVS